MNLWPTHAPAWTSAYEHTHTGHTLKAINTGINKATNILVLD